jgi:hypothetical protein
MQTDQTRFWVYNLANDNYSDSLDIGFGGAFKKQETVYNMLIEPRFSVAEKGPRRPNWHAFRGLTLPFFHHHKLPG